MARHHVGAHDGVNFLNCESYGCETMEGLIEINESQVVSTAKRQADLRGT